MITKAIQAIKEIFIPDSEFEEDIVCSLDDEQVDCLDLQDNYDEGESFKQDAINYYTGVPAPAYLDDDDWFGPAPVRSQKQLDYMERETEIKVQEEQRREEMGGEPDNIHDLMYQIASKNWNTVVESQGGSENFHQGPGGWNSGNGMGQFHGYK